MRHSAIHAQNGALSNNGHSRLTIEDNRLSDAHGANVSLTSPTGARLLRNDISRSGQEGVHVTAADDVTIQGNTIHHNNTEQFSEGWEAGGLKATRLTRLALDANDVHHNAGPGLWCDIDCRNVTFSNSRVHRNGNMGIQFEIGDGAKIFGNALWENGRAYTVWGWGGRHRVASSSNAEVYHDTVAWNADGISVIAQNRGSEGRTVGNHVHDNTVVMAPPGEYLSGWFQDWAGTLFRSESSNRGANSR